MRRRRRLFPLTIALVAIAAALALTGSWWLPALGWALVRDEGPAKADLAVVLGGDFWGNRIKKGGELVRQGYVPAALVSGPPGVYGQHESEPEIAYAVRQGYPSEYFIAFPDEARSTQDEAAMILPELRRRNVRSRTRMPNCLRKQLSSRPPATARRFGRCRRRLRTAKIMPARRRSNRLSPRAGPIPQP